MMKENDERKLLTHLKRRKNKRRIRHKLASFIVLNGQMSDQVAKE